MRIKRIEAVKTQTAITAPLKTGGHKGIGSQFARHVGQACETRKQLSHLQDTQIKLLLRQYRKELPFGPLGQFFIIRNETEKD